MLEKPFLNTYNNTEELKKDSKKLFKSIFYSGRILDENKALREKIEGLEVNTLRIKYLESLLKENKNIILFNPNIIYTSIIKKNNNGVLTILGGSDSGFNIGDTVLSYDGTLLGEVADVFDLTSTINLFIKEGVETDGVLYIGGDLTSLNMIGKGDALFAELNREVNVNIGDIVYSQGEPGYVIGTVSYIDFDPRDPLKEVYISPIHGIQSLQRVGVIVKKN